MKIQDILKSLGNEGCLLLCYCKLADISIKDLIENFNDLISYKAIEEDSYVSDANKVMSYFNKDYLVKKTDISNIKNGQEYIASYEAGNANHFVICKDGKVIYNTLENSYCVKNGRPNKIVRILEKV